MKLIQHWLAHKKKSLFLLISWILTITFLSLVDLRKIDLEIDINPWFKFDKIVHFIFYFVFTGLFINYYKKVDSKKNYFIPSFFIAIIYGTIIEILQDIVPTKRSFDVLDMFANDLGSLTMILIFLKKNKNT